MLRHRTFIMHVEDLPGVLNRVTSLFRRRNYNIESLAVGRTEIPGVSRMTIVMEVHDDDARRIEANLYKLVNVLRVEDTTWTPNVTRELALIKVRATTDTRTPVLQLAELYRAHVLDVGPDAMILEITGARDKIDTLVEMLAPLGIIELVRTGAVAMVRSAEAATVPIVSNVEAQPRTNAA